MEVATSGMEVLTTAITNVGTLASSALTTIEGNPIFMLGIGASMLGLAISIVRKFLHVR